MNLRADVRHVFAPAAVDATVCRAAPRDAGMRGGLWAVAAVGGRVLMWAQSPCMNHCGCKRESTQKRSHSLLVCVGSATIDARQPSSKVFQRFFVADA